ncbi:MAG TPA: DUF927 domain-containing protein [Holophaga sp.]|nr:DUF927 domain-containing protein [Holophaga sp.]
MFESVVPFAGADPARPCFPPYRLDRSGLWLVPGGSGEKGEPLKGPQRLCDPFQVLAETRDACGNAWGLLLRWEDRDGEPHEAVLPRELALGEGTELTRMLVRQGLWVAPDEASRRKLVGYLATVRVPGRARLADRVGWHGTAFLLPDGTFGDPEPDETLHLVQKPEHAFRQEGTMEGWKASVARHAQGNSRLAFALSCAFAAPLLERLGLESGGFHFFGSSSKGKTTTLDVAGSVWGGPCYHDAWRATSSGLEAVALAHCDGLLTLDEQGQALPQEAGEVAYLLANGQDKLRARKTLDGQPRRRWRTLFLSTGETTMADRMQEGGRPPRAGQEVRLVDVPANPDGLDQVFETWEGFPSSQALADHLKRAVRLAYGTPIRPYLDNLGRMDADALADLEGRRGAWARGHLPPRADSQVARVVDRFALAAVAGELATRWGLLPWRVGNGDWAAATCLRDWLAHRGGLGSGERERGLAAVLGFIERHGLSRFAEWNGKGERVANCAGYRQCDCHGRMDYLFHAEGWKEACRGFCPKEVARACADAGLLEPVLESGRLRLQKNIRVPGRGTERFHVLTGRGLERFRDRQAEAVEG